MVAHDVTLITMVPTGYYKSHLRQYRYYNGADAHPTCDKIMKAENETP